MRAGRETARRARRPGDSLFIPDPRECRAWFRPPDKTSRHLILSVFFAWAQLDITTTAGRRCRAAQTSTRTSGAMFSRAYPQGSASIAALAGGEIGANRQRLSQKYRRGGLYESLTHRMPLKMGARVTRPSDRNCFETVSAGLSYHRWWWCQAALFLQAGNLILLTVSEW